MNRQSRNTRIGERFGAAADQYDALSLIHI